MPKKVLFVDNDPSERSDYCQKLRYSGFEVIEIADGNAAFNAILAKKPDLVITEVMVPTLNGFDLLQKIRQRPSIANLPVVFVTHLGDEMAMAKKMGANEYLIKSQTDPQTLANVVTSLLNK